MVAPFRRIPTVQSLDQRELDAVFRWVDWNFSQYPTGCAAVPVEFRRLPTFPGYDLDALNALFGWVDWNFRDVPVVTPAAGGWPRRVSKATKLTAGQVNDRLRWIDWNFRHMPDYCSPSSPPVVEIGTDPCYFPQINFISDICQHRVIDRTSGGIIWLLQQSGPGSPPSPYDVNLYHSNDAGATWQIATSGADPSQGFDYTGLSWYIDEQDYAHVMWYEGAPNYWRYARGISTGTGWTWSTPYNIPTADGPTLTNYNVDIVAFDIGGDVYVHWASSRYGAANGYYGSLKVANIGGVPTVTVHQSRIALLSVGSSHIDFDHTAANPKTPTATPHIYIGIDTSGGPDEYRNNGYFKRISYTAGPTWNTGLATNYIGYVGGIPEMMTDGTNAWFAGVGSSTADNLDTVFVRQRDLLNTTSTSHPASASLTDPIRAFHASLDSNGDIQVFAAAGTGAYWVGSGWWNLFDTSAGSWAGWQALPTFGTGIRRDTQSYGGQGLVAELASGTLTPYYAAVAAVPGSEHIFLSRTNDAWV